MFAEAWRAQQLVDNLLERASDGSFRKSEISPAWGRPVRSWIRRISSLRVASRVAVRFFLELASTNWSIHPWPSGVLYCGRFFRGGMKAKIFCLLRGRFHFLVGLPPLATRGSGAPMAIHSESSQSPVREACAWAAFEFALVVNGSINRLSPGWPGTITGPESPPLRMPCLESRKRPPLRLRASAEGIGNSFASTGRFFGKIDTFRAASAAVATQVAGLAPWPKPVV